MAERLGLAEGLPGPAHRAGYDARVTARLLLHLAAAMPTPSVADLVDGGRSVRPRSGRQQEDAAATLFEVP